MKFRRELRILPNDSSSPVRGRCRPEPFWQFINAAKKAGVSSKEPAERREGYIYVLQAGLHFKIGLTKDLSARIKQLAIQLPFPAVLVCAFEVQHLHEWERSLHEMFAEKRINGEWFEMSHDDLCSLFLLLARIAGDRALLARRSE